MNPDGALLLALRQTPPAPASAPSPLRRAAVLVPLLARLDGLHLLLTRRTDTVSTHRGQVAFPGGGAEPQDADERATALREAEEEVGLPPPSVEVLTTLDCLPTVRGDTLVRPVVGLVKGDPPLIAQASEVARIFTIPLSALRAPESWTSQPFYGRPGRVIPVFSFPYDGEVLWGLSALFTLKLLHLGPPPWPVPPEALPVL